MNTQLKLSPKKDKEFIIVLFLIKDPHHPQEHLINISITS